jgi:hypothetical protein
MKESTTETELTATEIEALSAKNKNDDANKVFERKLEAMGHDDPYFALKIAHEELQEELGIVQEQSLEYKERLAHYLVEFIIHACDNSDQHIAETIIKNLL